jgi:threonine/homoserine/homoserine lactone efflux protein
MHETTSRAASSERAWESLRSRTQARCPVGRSGPLVPDVRGHCDSRDRDAGARYRAHDQERAGRWAVRRRFTALGVVPGQLTWALATSVGLVTILLASAPVFYIVKLAGAMYLIALGAQSLLAALRSGHRVPSEIVDANGPRIGAALALRQGIINNLGNPKMAVFFASILPQFAPHDCMFADSVLLGVTLAVLTMVWLTLYALAVAAVGSFLQRRHVRRAIEAAPSWSGSVSASRRKRITSAIVGRDIGERRGGSFS